MSQTERGVRTLLALGLIVLAVWQGCMALYHAWQAVPANGVHEVAHKVEVLWSLGLYYLLIQWADSLLKAIK